MIWAGVGAGICCAWACELMWIVCFVVVVGGFKSNAGDGVGGFGVGRGMFPMRCLRSASGGGGGGAGGEQGTSVRDMGWVFGWAFALVGKCL